MDLWRFNSGNECRTVFQNSYGCLVITTSITLWISFYSGGVKGHPISGYFAPSGFFTPILPHFTMRHHLPPTASSQNLQSSWIPLPSVHMSRSCWFHFQNTSFTLHLHHRLHGPNYRVFLKALTDLPLSLLICIPTQVHKQRPWPSWDISQILASPAEKLAPLYLPNLLFTRFQPHEHRCHLWPCQSLLHTQRKAFPQDDCLTLSF